jgi:hypothetical protein
MRVLPYSLAAIFSLGLSATAALGQSAPLRWAEGAPNATSDMKDGNKIEGLKTDDIHIFVSLSDVQQTEYNRVWVQVSNHGKTPVDFDPQSAILITEKDKTVRAEDPDKAANSIQKFGEAKSQELSSAHCTMMTATGCQPTNAQMQMSKQVLAFSGQQAAWVRENELKKKTLAPGDEMQGAILFRKEKKRANYTLRIPVGSQLFEFPVSAQNKQVSYD